MMMLIGREMAGYDDVLKVQVPPWDDPTDDIHSPFDDFPAPEMVGYDDVLEVVEYDDFRMYEFKVRRCARGRSHDWTECPYAHPGEKARRRDPRKFHYSGNPCPEFRKGTCGKGDTCEFAHGVFECWLHPSRYRTQPCKDGVSCRRRICFFAHTPEQLRVLPVSYNGSTQTHPESYDGSPSRFGIDSFVASPTSTLYPPPCSPPMSPIGSNSVNELASSIRNLQIGNAARFVNSPAFCSSRSLSTLRPGFASLPATPTRNPTRSGQNAFDNWDQNQTEEEPMMERVESGRELRAKIYAKLSRENSLAGRVDSPATGSESGWVYELVN